MQPVLVVAGLVAAPVIVVAAVVALARASRRPVPGYRLSDYGGFETVDGLSIHLWQAGAERGGAVPVILIHGFGASNWCWRHTIGPLSARRWVLAPDLPGFGLSDKPAGFDYGLSGYARFIVSFMDAMGIGRAVLVGNSMGGGVAVSAALSAPDRVAGLVLIDSLGYYRRSFQLYRLVALPVVRDLVMGMAGRRSIGLLLKWRVYHDPSRLDDETARRFTAAYRTENGRKAPIWVYRGLAPLPVIARREIGAVRAPTLVIWGEHDKILPASHAMKFGADIAGSTTVVIPGTGHVPHEERPDAVNRLILDFIDGAGA
jgi:pimeloyl-ACP methyl ester carboxylesterase